MRCVPFAVLSIIIKIIIMVDTTPAGFRDVGIRNAKITVKFTAPPSLPPAEGPFFACSRDFNNRKQVEEETKLIVNWNELLLLSLVIRT